METIKIQHLFGRISIFFLVLIVVVFAEEYSINRLCLNINVLCLHIDMKNTSKSTLLLYSEDLDEGIDYKAIPLFKFYESVSENLRIS